MRGIVVFCPNMDCRKHLIRDAKLRPGCTFTVRCYSCGFVTRLDISPGGINRTLIENARPVDKETEIKSRDEDEGYFGVIINS